MRDPIRVLVLGTGNMGSGIARLVLEKPGLELVGVYGRSNWRGVSDAGEAIGLDRKLGLPLSTDLDAVIAEARPEVGIQATCSTLEEGIDELAALVSNGVNVISIAEEMAYPMAHHPDIEAELEERAVAAGVSVLGTGVNPGFVLDYLVLVLSGVCSDIRSISVTRVNDLSPYGPTVLVSEGIGLTPEEFEEGRESGMVVGHRGFDESIAMIADALGWEIDSIEETLDPIVAEVRREALLVTVEPGEIAGCAQEAVAYRDGEPVITLFHAQEVCPEVEGRETADAIEIDGTPPVSLYGSPEIAGGAATISLAVNAIPQVLNAPPGLYCMADLPVSPAMLADARGFLADANDD
jgi:hypothetical protein